MCDPYGKELEPMELIVLIVGMMLVFAAVAAAVAAFATLVAAFVRVFRRPLERWFEWMEDSFYGGGRR